MYTSRSIIKRSNPQETIAKVIVINGYTIVVTPWKIFARCNCKPAYAPGEIIWEFVGRASDDDRCLDYCGVGDRLVRDELVREMFVG